MVTKIELIDAEADSYNNPVYRINRWGNIDYATFTSSGLDITKAYNNDGSASAAVLFDTYHAKAGETIRVKGNFKNNAGTTQLIINEVVGANLLTANLSTGIMSMTYTFAVDREIGIYIYSGLTETDFSFTDVEISVDLFNQYFPTLPAETAVGSDIYYFYNRETLNYLLPEGLYYLKITLSEGFVLYSEWFLVDCLFDNLITTFVNVDYNAFSASGTTIIRAVESGASGRADSSHFDMIAGETAHIIFFLTITSGQTPSVRLYNVTASSIVSTHVLSSGLNDIEIAANSTGEYYLYIYNSAASEFFTSEILVIRDYSDKYIAITFKHSCNLGDIVYDTGFEQVLYLQSEPMESAFPYVEKGAENGYGLFVPTYQRQDKTYIIRTLLIADYIVDVLHRLKLHDTISLTDLVGDVHEIDEIDTEHTWQFEDKYYATASVTVNLGEQIIITGCCTAINECN